MARLFVHYGYMKVRNFTETPVVEDIGDDILRFKLPQPFYADNNIYIIKGDEPAMIDSGFALNLGMLQAALKSVGLSLRKIRHIFYTHNHIDHISAALNIPYYTDAVLYGMQGMAAEVGHFGRYLEAFNRASVRLLYKAIKDPEVRRQKAEAERNGHREFMESMIRTKKNGSDPENGR
jgi:glyoxylase-like metal-dependent hydrolase (beta-lactamase superfamily II)